MDEQELRDLRNYEEKKLKNPQLILVIKKQLPQKCTKEGSQMSA